MIKLEIHTDGTEWVACRGHKLYPKARIYHPNAKYDYSSNNGSDSHYKCPDCGKTWWVEYDG